MIKQTIKAGRKVWIDQCLSYDMPEGLPQGARVTVVSYDSQARSVTVRAEDGREWSVDPIHLDTGWRFPIGGHYFAEHTPKARAYIKALIAEVLATPAHPVYPELKQDRINTLEMILARNSRPRLAVS